MAYFIKYTAFCEESKKTQYKAIYLASLFAKFLYTKLNNLAMGFFCWMHIFKTLVFVMFDFYYMSKYQFNKC